VKKVDPGQLPHDIYVYEFPDLDGNDEVS
jgi:hypothetical protein